MSSRVWLEAVDHTYQALITIRKIAVSIFRIAYNLIAVKIYAMNDSMVSWILKQATIRDSQRKGETTRLLANKFLPTMSIKRHADGRDHQILTPHGVLAKKSTRFFLIFLLSLSLGFSPAQSAEVSPQTNISTLKVPAGFHINIFAKNINSPRQIAVATDGTVFVGSRSKKVYMLKDTNDDGHADSIHTISDNFSAPHGVAISPKYLYIGDIEQIWQLPIEAAKTGNVEEMKVFLDNIPSDQHHGMRTLGFGPDEQLYISFGVPCNICQPKGIFEGTIRRYQENGQGQTYASGIRNSVGFDWHPQTNELWFTDNGRDWLGDDMPHDELNHAPYSGLHFGFPYCHQGNLPDPEFGEQESCSKYVSPKLLAGPHVATLGMKFYQGSMFPEEYQNAAFIALHGSWNRTIKSGYAIHVAHLSEDEETVREYEPFITGWLQSDQSVTGRPVDVEVWTDGSLLVSDDHAGVIYRVSYGNHY